MVNTKLLEAKIRESGLKKGHIAVSLGVSRTTLCALMQNKTEFRASQIETLCAILGIEDNDTLRAIFFA